VLVELAGAEQAARMLARLARSPIGSSTVSLMRLGHHEGSLTGITSMVSVRPLQPPSPRRAKPFPDRPSPNPPSTPPPRT